jgi:hypothetical protein
MVTSQLWSYQELLLLDETDENRIDNGSDETYSQLSSKFLAKTIRYSGTIFFFFVVPTTYIVMNFSDALCG